MINHRHTITKLEESATMITKMDLTRLHVKYVFISSFGIKPYSIWSPYGEDCTINTINSMNSSRNILLVIFKRCIRMYIPTYMENVN